MGPVEPAQAVARDRRVAVGAQHREPRGGGPFAAGDPGRDPHLPGGSAEVPRPHRNRLDGSPGGAHPPEPESLARVGLGVDHRAVGRHRRVERHPLRFDELDRIPVRRIHEQQPVAVLSVPRGPVDHGEAAPRGRAGTRLRGDRLGAEETFGAVRLAEHEGVGRRASLVEIEEAAVAERLRAHLEPAPARQPRRLAGRQRELPEIEVSGGGGAEIERLAVFRPRRIEQQRFVPEEQLLLSARHVHPPDGDAFGVVAQKRESASVRRPRRTRVHRGPPRDSPGDAGCGIEKPEPSARRERDRASVGSGRRIGGSGREDGQLESLDIHVVRVAVEFRVAVRPLRPDRGRGARQEEEGQSRAGGGRADQGAESAH